MTAKNQPRVKRMKTDAGSASGILFLTSILTWAVCSVAAHPLDNWYGRYTNAAIRGLSGVTFGQGRFVAVGDQGTILTSETGEPWTAQVSGKIGRAHV